MHEGTKTPAELAAGVRAAFEQDLRPHFEIEENVLLPAIEQELGPWELCRRITEEHRELERRACALAQSADEAALRAFTALLRSHVRMEENELFEQLQARLGEESLAALGTRLEAAGSRACQNRGSDG